MKPHIDKSISRCALRRKEICMSNWKCVEGEVPSPLSEDPIVARHLYAQGFKTPDDLIRLTSDCLPYHLDNEDALFALIDEAVKGKLPIVVVGDYDVDGIIATTNMSRFLKAVGAIMVRQPKGDPFEIPSRHLDGYGLSKNLVDRAEKDGAKIIITVDNGTTAKDAVDYALAKGIRTFITDHHQPTVGTMPDKAVGIVNPMIGNSDKAFHIVCGACVAYIIACDYMALKGIDKEPANAVLLEQLREATAIATVADVMPLWYGNRTLVEELIEKIKNGKVTNPAVSSLIKLSSVSTDSADSTTIGFTLAPELNAPGRLVSAVYPARLFMVANEASMLYYSKYCVMVNGIRKSLTREMMKDVDLSDASGVITVLFKDANEGIIGIVAGRVTEASEKPSFVFSKGDDGICKGSGRSPLNYNLIEGAKRVFASHPEFGTKFGGHAGAMGLTLSNEAAVEAFGKAMSDDYSAQHVKPIESIYIPLDLSSRSLASVYEAFEPYRPFGECNEDPVFRISGKASNVHGFAVSGGVQFDVQTPDGLIAMSWFRGTVEEGTEYDFYFNISKEFHSGNAEYSGVVVDAAKKDVQTAITAKNVGDSFF